MYLVVDRKIGKTEGSRLAGRDFFFQGRKGKPGGEIILAAKSEERQILCLTSYDTDG